MERVFCEDIFSCNNLKSIFQIKVGTEEDIIIPIGKTEKLYIFENLTQIPGSFIAGVSGCGKTSYVRTLLTEMMMKYSPDKVAFIIFDDKGVDYKYLNNNPYLLFPVEKDIRSFQRILSWLSQYSKERLHSREQFPHLFIIIDDYARLHSYCPDILDYINSILGIARLAKIHFLFVASSPSSKCFPPHLKNIVIHRTAFCLAASQSKIVIDRVGAENLQLPGEIIIKLYDDFFIGKALYLDDSICAKVNNDLTYKYKEQSISNRKLLPDPEFRKEGTYEEDTSNDDLLPEALRVAIDSGIVSVSMIQRKLRIGYGRAARLVDIMEEKGYVSSFDESNPRRVLIKRTQLESLYEEQH